MDEKKIIEVIKLTLDPNMRAEAEKQLDQMYKIIGFSPILLQLLIRPEIHLPIRQATVIYFKNLVTNYWFKTIEEKSFDANLTPDNSFVIHEQDRGQIRDRIIDTLVNTPIVIQSQLVVSVSHIAQNDFPNYWPQIVDKIHLYLTSTNNTNILHGALLCLNRLVRIYEYKKVHEIKPLIEALNMLLPLVYQLMCNLMVIDSDESYLLQKLILKTFFALTHYNLPLDLLNQAIFTHWMEVFRRIIERPVPENACKITNTLSPDDLNQMLSWKCKKWASTIIERIFERYGQPGSVEKLYKDFAPWYLETFSVGIIEVYLKVLDVQRKQEFVASRLLQRIFMYLNNAIRHAYTWKLLKSHMLTIVQDILFPTLCHTSEDEDLWASDPLEYIHLKFESFHDLISPTVAAEHLIISLCKKRKNMLEGVMMFIVQVLNETPRDPNRLDGALRVIGLLSPLLMKKEMYNSQLDTMFERFVIPEFVNSAPHLRARICWICSHFHTMTFKDNNMAVQIIQNIINLFLNDKELPVKIEASVAILMFMDRRETIFVETIRQGVCQITHEALRLTRETECEDIVTMLQKIFTIYIEDLIPIAAEICNHLSTSYLNLISEEEFGEEKTLLAMHILNALELLMTCIEDHQEELLFVLEPRVLPVVLQTLSKKITEFYEEALTILFYLTTKKISDSCFGFFEVLYGTVMDPNGGAESFVEMMPVFHNYIRVDSEKFLSNDNHVIAIYSICRHVMMTKDVGEDAHCYAAKLLEVMILQFSGRIDRFLPDIVQLAFEKLSSNEIKTSELRTLCLQVVIAVLYCNAQLLMKILSERLPPNTINDFVNLWIADSDCFLGLHDRKICVLGLLTLIEMNPNRPAILMQFRHRLVRILIMLLKGLKDAYAQKEKDEQDSYTSSELGDSSSESEDEVLNSSEDENGKLETQNQKFETDTNTTDVEDIEIGDDNDDDDDDNSNESSFGDFEDESIYESYSTLLEDNNSIDEYVYFKEVFNRIQTNEPEWYRLLFMNLEERDFKDISEIITLADKRKALAEDLNENQCLRCH